LAYHGGANRDVTLDRTFTLGTESFSLNDSQLYPNPSNGNFTVLAKTNLTKINVYTITGGFVKSIEVTDNAINAEINVGQSILKAHVDIMKVDLRIKEKNIMLIDFKKKNMSTIDVAMDPGIGATALAFSRNKNEIIQYVIVEINESNKKLFITQAIFRPEQLQNTYKMICSVEENIRKKINYGDRWKCQECKQCPSFKSLMREDFLLRQ
jgi:hypothetical protein